MSEDFRKTKFKMVTLGLFTFLKEHTLFLHSEKLTQPTVHYITINEPLGDLQCSINGTCPAFSKLRLTVYSTLYDTL